MDKQKEPKTVICGGSPVGGNAIGVKEPTPSEWMQTITDALSPFGFKLKWFEVVGYPKAYWYNSTLNLTFNEDRDGGFVLIRDLGYTPEDGLISQEVCLGGKRLRRLDRIKEHVAEAVRTFFADPDWKTSARWQKR